MLPTATLREYIYVLSRGQSGERLNNNNGVGKTHHGIGQTYLLRCHVKNTITEDLEQLESTNSWGRRPQEKSKRRLGGLKIFCHRSGLFSFFSFLENLELRVMPLEVIETVIAVTIYVPVAV